MIGAARSLFSANIENLFRTGLGQNAVDAVTTQLYKCAQSVYIIGPS